MTHYPLVHDQTNPSPLVQNMQTSPMVRLNDRKIRLSMPSSNDLFLLNSPASRKSGFTKNPMMVNMNQTYDFASQDMSQTNMSM